MHSLYPDLTGPQSLEQALRLRWGALDSRVGGRSLPSFKGLSKLEGCPRREWLAGSLLREAQTESSGHNRDPPIDMSQSNASARAQLDTITR
jgi:hypothetical protein